jgi:hypothetical protein
LKAKRTILILSDWFLPGYKAGGPIQSIANLVAHLHEEFKIKIITTDRDFKSNQAYDSVELDKWLNLYGVEVYYVGIDNLHSNYILNLIQSTPHDLLYLNSLFSKYFAVMPLRWKKKGLIHSKIVLAPRGMLRKTALAVKPIKKKLFLRYAKIYKLFQDVIWQSTSKEETFEIKKEIGTKVNVIQISNFPSASKLVNPITKVPFQLKLCFIARIVDIKNLSFAIDVLMKVNRNFKIQFDVYGPAEDEKYFEMCQEKACLLPNHISYNYKGPLPSDLVDETLVNYHTLFLPTQTENFGHIIVQSLQNGRPVLISDNTPWKNLSQHEAGFDINLTAINDFVSALETLAELDDTDYHVMCKSSKIYIDTCLNIENLKQEYINLFRS